MSKIEGKRFLIVEDESLVAMALARQIETMGGKVVGMASSEDTALALVAQHQPDLVLMDINLGQGGSGITTARKISRSLAVPVVYTTAYSDDHTMAKALEASAYGYVVKPYSLENLKTVVNLALERFRIEQKMQKTSQVLSQALAEERASRPPADTQDGNMPDVAFTNAQEGMLVLNKHQIVLHANRAICALLDKPEAELLGKSLSDLLSKSRATENLEQLLKSGHTVRTEINFVRRGESKSCLLSLSEKDDGKTDAAQVATFTDVTDMKDRERQLGDMAFKDSLTGAGNRHYLAQLLQSKNNPPYSIIFIDLDEFKQINDTWGHEAGDEVLVQCTGRLRSTIRANDKLVRMGGDEFVILSEDASLNLEIFGQRLLHALQKPMRIADQELRLCASVGIARNHNSCDMETLLKRADIAMYRTKELGKNQIAFYEDDLNELVDYRLFVGHGLEEAIRRGEIIAHYQPILDRTGRVTALEALARWDLGDAGIISPEKFIPVAEQTQLIHLLGLSIFREACIALKMLFDHNMHDIKMHINVSKMQLHEPYIAQEFHAMLVEFNVNIDQIVLEITESTLHDKTTRQSLDDLRAQGFAIAIDDFGSGQATLNELTLPAYNAIKLDKSLIPTSQEQQGKEEKILRHIVALCQDMQLPITAEGLESPAQVTFTHELGCSTFQGNFFSGPLHLFDALKFIAEHSPQRLTDLLPPVEP